MFQTQNLIESTLTESIVNPKPFFPFLSLSLFEMTVRVKLFATLQELAGISEIYIEADDVMSVLEQLVLKFGNLKNEIFEDYDRRKVRPRVKVMVNGYNIDHLQGFETRLIDGDRVAVFPVLAGG